MSHYVIALKQIKIPTENKCEIFDVLYISIEKNVKIILYIILGLIRNLLSNLDPAIAKLFMQNKKLDAVTYRPTSLFMST